MIKFPLFALLVATCSALSTVTPNPIIKAAAQGMTLLKPIFGLEAQLQAAVLGFNVDDDVVASELEQEIESNKALIYTYGLSPFSTEAVAMLDASGYEYTKIELGPEWFLLGGRNSVARVVLSKEDGATSLPKIFLGGELVGGCSELASLVDEGELDAAMKKARVPKMGAAKAANKSGPFSFFK